MSTTKVQQLINIDISLDDIDEDDLIDYVDESLRQEMLTKIGKEKVLDWLLDETNDDICYETMLDKLHKDHVEMYMERDPNLYIVKAENLNDIHKIETFLEVIDNIPVGDIDELFNKYK